MLEKWLISLKVCRESIRKWSGDPRIWALLALIFLFEWTPIQSIREECVRQGLSISCWFFPFLFMGIRNQFFFFGVLLLFCDAPFVDNQQMHIILRTGKQNWFRGKIMYIVLSACIYFLVMFLVSIIEFFPYIGFSLEWENIIQELSIVGIDKNITGDIKREIVVNFSPIEATLLTYIMCVLNASFLGLLIFYINLYKGHNTGLAVALTFVLCSGFVGSLVINVRNVLLYVTPVSWTDIRLFVTEYGGVPFPYAVAFLCVVNMLLIGLIMHKGKSYNIEAMEVL